MADFMSFSAYYTPEHSPIKVEMDDRSILSSCAYTQPQSVPCQPMSVIRDPVFDAGEYTILSMLRIWHTLTQLFIKHAHTRDGTHVESL